MKAILIALAIPGVPFLLTVLTPLATFSVTEIEILVPCIGLILLWEIIISLGEEPGAGLPPAQVTETFCR